MKTELRESMASGVFVEFCDGQGHTVGQAFLPPGKRPPLPAVGDQTVLGILCRFRSPPQTIGANPQPDISNSSRMKMERASGYGWSSRPIHLRLLIKSCGECQAFQTN